MEEGTLSERFSAHLAALQLQQVPEPVRDSAGWHLLDTLGVLLAGSRLEPGGLAYDLAISLTRASGAAGEITLPGTGERVPLLEGVLATAAAAHCGEMDDIHSGAGTCVGAMVIPALLALAEKYGGSGPRVLEAAIAGYETIVRLGLAIRAPGLFSRGWWPSTLCGAFGVAAAGAKLLGWPAEKIADAVGIASLHAGGMLTGGGEGATARHLAFGRSAQSGVLALLASAQGFHGPKRAFEEPRGFCLTLCRDPDWGYLEPDDRWFLPKVAFKPFPCARQLHAGVEGVLDLLREPGVAPASIEEIELDLPTPVAGMMDRPKAAESRAACLGSGQYVMAVTAFEERWIWPLSMRASGRAPRFAA